MWALRRVAARAAFTQPTRQARTLPSPSSFSRIEKPLLSRSFYQSQRWFLAEEQSKPEQASPADATTSGETVTTEPSAQELKEGAQQESVVQRASEQVQEAASSAAQTVQDAAAGAARTARDAFSRRSGRPFERDDRTRTREPVPGRILYVGNLPFEAKLEDVEVLFSPYGEITNSRLVTDELGRSKGFGYIEFGSQEAAGQAIAGLNQKELMQRRMSVQYHVRRERGAAPRSEKPPSNVLFIGNMSYQMSDRDLTEVFKDLRNVLDVRVAIDRRTGQPRGFAHADFIDVESAVKAKEYLQDKVIFGRKLRVDFTESRSSTQTTA